MREANSKGKSAGSWTVWLSLTLIALNLSPPYQSSQPELLLLPLVAALILELLSPRSGSASSGTGMAALGLTVGIPSAGNSLPVTPFGAAWALSLLLLLRFVLNLLHRPLSARSSLSIAAHSLPILIAVTSARFVAPSVLYWSVPVAYLLSGWIYNWRRSNSALTWRRSLETLFWFGFLLCCSSFGTWALLAGTVALVLIFSKTEIEPEQIQKSFSQQLVSTEQTLRASQQKSQAREGQFQSRLSLQNLLDRFQGEALQAETVERLTQLLIDTLTRWESSLQAAVVAQSEGRRQILSQTGRFEIAEFEPLPQMREASRSLRSNCGQRLCYWLDTNLLFLCRLHNDSQAAAGERFLGHLVARAGLIIRILHQKHELVVLLGERTSALEQLAESQSQLVQSEKLAAIGQLAAGVAHEINSPLAAIGLQVQLLRRRIKKQDHEGVASSLLTVEEAGDKAKRIIENLLVFSSLSDGLRRPVTLEAVISQTERLLEPQLNNEQVELSKKIASLPPLMANSQEISQILTNVMINAIDALKEIEGPRRIVIATQAEPGYQTLSVSNNGPPLSQSTTHRLFDPFFTTKKVGSGTGLGLFISLQLAKGHHGDLKADNVNGWVRFTLRLPDDAAPDESPATATESAEAVVAPKR